MLKIRSIDSIPWWPPSGVPGRIKCVHHSLNKTHELAAIMYDNEHKKFDVVRKTKVAFCTCLLPF